MSGGVKGFARRRERRRNRKALRMIARIERTGGLVWVSSDMFHVALAAIEDAGSPRARTASR